MFKRMVVIVTLCLMITMLTATLADELLLTSESEVVPELLDHEVSEIEEFMLGEYWSENEMLEVDASVNGYNQGKLDLPDNPEDEVIFLPDVDVEAIDDAFTVNEFSSTMISPDQEIMAVSSDDLVIMDNVLIKYNGVGGTVDIPEGVACIGEGAFEGCGQLDNVIVPWSVARIESRAFANSSIQEINLPEGISYIAPDAFLDCDSLIAIADNDGYAKEWCNNNGVKLAVGLSVSFHSQKQIQKFVDAHPARLSEEPIYAIARSDDPYYAGKLSTITINSAINMVNQFRYIAGLNADVVNDPQWEEAMMNAALVCRLNGDISHTPFRPSELSDSQYDTIYNSAVVGASSANLAGGSATFGYGKPTSSVYMYMDDTDSENKYDVGHRRWVLNPMMKKTAFGFSEDSSFGRESFTAMYVLDMSGSGNPTVAWPAMNTPLEYFDDYMMWSLSLGRVLDKSAISVSLRRESDGREWRFNDESSDGELYISNEQCGQVGCVIFHPARIALSEGDRYTVKVRDDEQREMVVYTVSFFSLDLSKTEPIDAPKRLAAANKEDGISLAWDGVSGAKGYFVMRCDNVQRLYNIVANVLDTDWIDTNVEEGKSYLYYIHSYNDGVLGGWSNEFPILRTKENFDASWGTCGVTIKDGVMTVHAGEGSDREEIAPWHTARDRITKIIFEDGVIFPVNCDRLFWDEDRNNTDLQEIVFNQIDTSKVKSVDGLFLGLRGLKSINMTNWNMSNVEDIGVMFGGCSSLVSVKLDGWNISKDCSALQTFSGCSSLKTLDLSKCDLSGVTRTTEMFRNCTELQTIEFGEWKMQNVTDVWLMFENCSSLHDLDVSKWNTAKVTNMGDMFSGCSSLETLDVSRWDVSNTIELQRMFKNCSSLKSLDLSGWDNKNTVSMWGFLLGCDALKTIKVGNEFCFNGTDGIISQINPVLPVDSIWKSQNTGKEYSVNQMLKNRHRIADTYIRSDITAEQTTSPQPAKLNLTKAKVTVKNQVYTGKPLKPSVTVKLDGKKLKKGTDYTVKYSSNKAVGTAKVTVTGNGGYTGKVTAAFKINPKKVSGLKLAAGEKKLTVTWKKVSGVSGYQLQYGTKKDFSNAKKLTVKRAGAVKATLKSLKAQKTYYVRIRAYKTVNKKKYYSAWVSAKKKTK